MTRPLRRRTAVLAAGALLLATSACGGGDQAAPTTPVALRLGAAPQKIVIGVVVTLTSDPGQGSEWSAAAEGAQVAGFRYRQGGLDVRIEPVNDRGTSDGGTAAVQQLVADKVSGIVMASEGSHLSGALTAARAAGVPVLLPYSTDTGDLTDEAWLTGPDGAAVGSALSGALRSRSIERPLLVDAGGGTPDGVVAIRRIRFTPGGDTTALAARVARLVDTGPRADGVVVSGAAQTEADVVAALQGRDLGVPILLTPQALSPLFATALDDAGGSLSSDLTTVGVEDADTAALQSGAQGVSASAFLAALRSAAQDPDLHDFFDGRSFATVAGSADTRSHDAVVALVRAAAEAGSAEPDAVARAIPGLEVTHGQGLGGPDLDFTAHAAVAPDQVVTLQSTPQGSGLRPDTGGSARLYWFSQGGR